MQCFQNSAFVWISADLEHQSLFSLLNLSSISVSFFCLFFQTESYTLLGFHSFSQAIGPGVVQFIGIPVIATKCPKYVLKYKVMQVHYVIVIGFRLYMYICKLARWCPLLHHRFTYDDCPDCWLIGWCWKAPSMSLNQASHQS